MVDFTTLHPFDFDRNLFNFLALHLVLLLLNFPIYGISNLKINYFAGLPKADANTILLKLQEHGFLKHNWMDLAIGLSMGGELGKYEAMRNDTVRLSNMVTDWTNGVEEQERWMTILTALKSSGYGIVARNLAKDLGIDFPN